MRELAALQVLVADNPEQRVRWKPGDPRIDPEIRHRGFAVPCTANNPGRTFRAPAGCARL